MSYKDKILPSGVIVENIPGWFKYRWFIKGTTILHNEGEPAYEYKNGEKIWCQHDKYHRLDGPTIEYADGNKSYYIDDFLYNEEDYWDHPDVIAYKYLKEHPELEGFI